MSKKRSLKKRATDNEYGMFFKKARIRKGVMQMDLARELGFSAYQLISNVERGLSGYPVARLSKVIQLLDLDPEEVIRLILRREEKKIRKVINKTSCGTD
jgi:transcriptional regulator with XRE-family HTH domain